LTAFERYGYGEVAMTSVALGADHAGWELKEVLKAWLISSGHQVVDMGTHSTESVDYPDYACEVAEAVVGAKTDRGVLVCGTGIGMSMAANRIPGVRAALCHDAFSARMSREHNDANVLALGARLTDPEAAVDILRVWLEADFAGGRHARRLAKIADLDARRPGAAAAGSPAPRERRIEMEEARSEAERSTLPAPRQRRVANHPLWSDAEPSR
jgi:ribose 5-phosphate isomerase B